MRGGFGWGHRPGGGCGGLTGREPPKSTRPLRKAPPPVPLDPLVQDDSACGTVIASAPPESKGFKPLCRCNEQILWEHNDKHQDAFCPLKGEPPGADGQDSEHWRPQKDLDCLGCHSMATVNSQAQITDQPITSGEGVSCLACHGA